MIRGLKSQPIVVTEVIIYRPAAPVKPYEFSPTTTDLEQATVNAVLTAGSSLEGEARAGWIGGHHKGRLARRLYGVAGGRFAKRP